MNVMFQTLRNHLQLKQQYPTNFHVKLLDNFIISEGQTMKIFKKYLFTLYNFSSKH